MFIQMLEWLKKYFLTDCLNVLLFRFVSVSANILTLPSCGFMILTTSIVLCMNVADLYIILHLLEVPKISPTDNGALILQG